MPEEIRKTDEEYQKLSKDGLDAAVHSFGEVNKVFQSIAAEVTDYPKKDVRGGLPRSGASPRSEVSRAGNRNPIPIRQEGI